MFGFLNLDWYAVALLVINAGLSFIPARIAGKKGYSFIGHWCISFFVSFVLGILFASVLPPKSAESGETEPPTLKRTFSGSYLGFVIMGVMLTFTLILASLSPVFYSINAIINTIIRLMPFGLLAIAVALTTRAKGPDLSLGAVITFSGVVGATVSVSGGSVAVSIMAALLVAALAGAITGALTVTLRLPSMLASTAVSIALSAFSRVISHGRPVIADAFSGLAKAALLPCALIILPVALIFAFLLIYFTRLGKPVNVRASEENHSLIHFNAYVIGAVLAGVAGVYVLLRVGSAVPTESSTFPSYILFIFGAVLSSRLLDNRWASVLYAAVAGILYVCMSTAMDMLNAASFWQVALTILFALAFIAVGAFANRKAIANMLAFK